MTLRIGLVTTSFPRTRGDHAGAFVLGFARALVSCGHRVEVLAPEPPIAEPHWSEPGIDVVHVPYLRPRRWQRTFYGAGAPENLATDPRAWIGVVPFLVALREAVAARAHRWDSVVSHWALPAGLVVGHVLGPTDCDSAKPHLVVCHSADVHALSRLPGGARLARIITNRASSMLFVAPALRDRWLSLLGPIDGAAATVRCHVSPMGVERPPRERARRESRRFWRMDRFTFVSLGRLVPVKGLDVLIAATAGRRDIEVIVAGDGPERRRLERLAALRGAPWRFIGMVEGDAKHALLDGADAMVVASRVLANGRTEGAPTAMLEAMRAGLPVIASAVGGIPSIVETRGAALLVPPDDPHALRGAMEQVRTDVAYRRRLSRAGSSLARSLEWERLAPALSRLVAPVLPRVSGGATDAPLWGSSYGAPQRS